MIVSSARARLGGITCSPSLLLNFPLLCGNVQNITQWVRNFKMLFCNLWSVFDQQIPVLFFSVSSPMTVRETPLICTFPSGSREEMLLFVLHRWICANTLILLRWDGKYVSMPFHILSASQITSTERKIIYIYIYLFIYIYMVPCSVFLPHQMV